MSKKPRFWIQLGLALGLVALGAVGLAVLTLSKPPMAQRRPQPVLPLVRTVTVEVEPLPVVVEGEGTVSPLRRSVLSSEVRGRVVYVSPRLVSGGMVAKGEVLVRVEDRDYHLALTLARAKVKEAETAFQRTQEDAAAALEEWRRYEGAKGLEPPPLVAHLPQLEEAKAKLAAARAQLAQAELDLKRTTITAPYRGRISAKYVDLGQYLRAGDRVAEIYGTEAAEVVVHLEDDALAWIKVPGLTQRGGRGSPAKVYTLFSGKRVSWPGRVMRALGELDPRTRMVPVVVRVAKPFATQPPLAPGMFVKVEIHGVTLAKAVRLPRAALRQGGVVWVVDAKGVLRFRKVEVARFYDDQALIRSGLAQGEQVVVTPLEAVTDGMSVRVVQPGKGAKGRDAAPAGGEARS